MYIKIGADSIHIGLIIVIPATLMVGQCKVLWQWCNARQIGIQFEGVQWCRSQQNEYINDSGFRHKVASQWLIARYSIHDG